ncbi:MAG TPA: porin family protein [Rhodanobacteraceae bacterium]
MNKRILVIGLALALGGLSTSALAGNAGEPGQFYVGAGVGQAKWHVDHDSDIKLDNTDTTANLRFGYVWHWNVDFAVEGGYVDLGKITADWHDTTDDYHETLKSQGLFAGAKVKYGFAGNWYVDGRGGLFQGQVKDDQIDNYVEGSQAVTDTFRENETKTGWYAGVGVGCNLSRQFSLGLNYDYYHSKLDDLDINIGAVTVSAEYRF